MLGNYDVNEWMKKKDLKNLIILRSKRGICISQSFKECVYVGGGGVSVFFHNLREKSLFITDKST